MILTGKLTLFQCIKNWFKYRRLRRRGIDIDDLKLNILVQNFLDKNPRSSSSLDPKILVMPDLDFSYLLNLNDYSEFFEVSNENTQK